MAVVNAAIVAHVYTDESVLIKDLIYPERGLVAANPSFQKFAEKYKLSLADFSNKFLTLVREENDLEFTRFIESMNAPVRDRRGSIADATANAAGTSGNPAGDVTIYYPYTPNRVPPEDYPNDIVWGPIETLVTATADANSGTGRQWGEKDGISYSRFVTVDDNYAYNNPTHIVGLNGVEPYAAPTSANAGIAPTGPISLPGATREIKQVYLGEVLCKKQCDALISFTGNGGGPEIVFTRADGFLKIMDGQVQADVFWTPKRTIDRWHVRNKKFDEFFLSWDGDWETTNLNQNLAIYEDDTQSDIEISGTVKTTLKDPTGNSTEGSIGFKKTFHSNDELIAQNNLNFQSFFALNRTNLESQMQNGWPVRDRTSNVSYTLQDRTYKP